MRTLILAVAVALMACGGSEAPAPPPLTGFAAAIQGTWVSQCSSGVNASSRTVITISGLRMTDTYTLWAVPDCAGAGSSTVGYSGAFSIGLGAVAPFGAVSVMAYPVDLPGGGDGLLMAADLLYVDAAAVPDRLYHGQMDSTHFGTTPADRPVAIEPAAYLTRQ